MMITTTRARILVAICCVVLLLPVLGIRLQNDVALQQFHNRTLIGWPLASEFLSDPTGYFGKARGWIADRVYPIIGTSELYKKLLFYVLDTPPQHRVSLGKDGFIFLNGETESSVNGLLERICITVHTKQVGAEFSKSLQTLAHYASEKKIAVDVVIVPTTATLYADYLPASVPPKYLSACRARATGDSPLLRIAKPPGVNFIYPFNEMKAARGDEAFFPKGNWHASGLSLKVVRDAYLASRDIPATVDEQLERIMAPSEILFSYGIVDNLPVYMIHNEHVKEDTQRLAALIGTVGDLFMNPSFGSHYYENSSPVVAESVLMVSDSYGELSSGVFAGAFQQVFQVSTHSLPSDHLRELVDRVAREQHIDRLMLLVQEGGAQQIIEWSKALSQ